MRECLISLSRRCTIACAVASTVGSATCFGSAAALGWCDQPSNRSSYRSFGKVSEKSLTSRPFSRS